MERGQRPERNTLELKIRLDQADSATQLKNTANRMWRESEEIRTDRSKETERKQKAFLIALIDYWTSLGVEVPDDKFDKQEIRQDGFKPNRYCLGVLQIYTELSRQSASDALLFEKIKDCTDDVFNSSRDKIPQEYTYNDSYINVYKSIWGEGIQSYLASMIQRREALDELDLIEHWKPSLKLKEIKTEEDRKKAELDIFSKIESVLEEVKLKLFKDKPDGFCANEIETNSIGELQGIWKRESGYTLKSWELKQKAYIKLMLIYSIMKVIGTVNFEQKRQRKRTIERLFEKDMTPDSTTVEVNLKEEASVAMKDLKHFLSDTTEPDPRTIRDHVRVRREVDFPPGVLETNNIFEIKDYVVKEITRVIGTVGTSYSFARLRNSWVAKGINNNSGGKHRAFQFTAYPLNDIKYEDVNGKANESTRQLGFPDEIIMSAEELNSKNSIVKPSAYGKETILQCPETFPFEVQLVGPMTPEERKKDIEDYERRKIKELKTLLGCDVKFEDYLDHLSELFIKQVKMPEEKSGGVAGLSEKERLALAFLKILSTDDHETFQYLRNAYSDKKENVLKKYNKAISTIAKYWDSKMQLFMLDKIRILQGITEYSNDKLKSSLRASDQSLSPERISYLFDLMQRMISTLHDFESEITQLPPYDLVKIKEKIKELSRIHSEIENEDKDVAYRIANILSQIFEYYTVHYENKDNDIETLTSNAEEGLHNLFR